MLRITTRNKRAFYVVQFIELPFEGIDEYVCVPSTWLIVRRAMDQKAVVAYPKDEDPFDTRDRAERKERCSDEWRFYMAVVKYESDTYRDAEFWIATRNDHGPLVEEESNVIDMQQRLTWNKKLRSARRCHSSRSNDNPRKPLPRISIKRPALSEPMKQLDGKRLKLDGAAQSCSAVVNDVNAEPGSSKTEQSIIIHNNQAMECAQTGETAAASNSEKSIEQWTRPPNERNGHALSLPVTDVDGPTEVITIDGENLSHDVKQRDENNVISHSYLSSNTTAADETTQSYLDNQQHFLQSVSSVSNFQPRIENVRSIATTYNDQEQRIHDVLNSKPPTSHHLLNSLKMSANLYNHMTGGRRLVPIQKPIERRIRPMNIARNIDIAAQNSSNLMDPTGTSSTRSVEEQQLHASQGAKPTENRDTGLITGPQNIAASLTRDVDNSEMPTCSFYQSPRIQHSSAHDNMYQNQLTQKQLVNQSTGTNSKMGRVHINDDVARSPVFESHLNVMDSACQTDECMVEDPLSPYYAITSDSGVITDHLVISDHETSTDEAPVETSNNVYCTGSSSADRPAAQNSTSTNHQMHPRVVLEQQMLDNFATLFTQMGSTLRYTCDMYNELRSSIHETAVTYKQLLNSFERFNALGNPASNASPSSNGTPDISQAIEERQTARASSTNKDQHSNYVANEALKKKRNLWQFVLPYKYDPHDTRWTLTHRTNTPGLVELMPQSRIYVGYGELKYCKQVSKNCKSLARRLLPEVFNREALSVCLSMTEQAQANEVGSDERPRLDEHASKVFLKFVLEHGLQCGWKTNLQPILSTLHTKIQEIRFKYGVMKKC